MKRNQFPTGWISPKFVHSTSQSRTHILGASNFQTHSNATLLKPYQKGEWGQAKSLTHI